MEGEGEGGRSDEKREVGHENKKQTKNKPKRQHKNDSKRKMIKIWKLGEEG